MTNIFNDAEKELIHSVKLTLLERLETFNLTIEKVNRSKSYFVSGGCIGSWLRGEEPNDIDIYFFSKSSADPIVKLYSHDESYKKEVAIKSEKYRDVPGHPGNEPCITENAITLNNKLQLITKHYGQPDEIRRTFDFVHCTPYYDSRDDKLYISRIQYDLNKSKLLLVNSAATWTTYREQKFKNRGWKYRDAEWQ